MKPQLKYQQRFIRKFYCIITFILLFTFTTTLFAGNPPQTTKQTGQIDRAVFDKVQEQVAASGQYHFIANVEQTLIPRPIVANIGKGEERVDTRITGNVTLPDSATLTLQFEAGLDVPPLTLEQDGGKTYLLRDGQRQEIENPLGPVAPTAEFLGYLQAAQNIQLKPNTDHPDLTIYTFEVDGLEYASYVRDVAQSQLPPGKQDVILSPSPILQQMTGQGELWVDVDGYPRRQILDIHIPEINEQYHSQAYLVVDYVIEAALVGVPSLKPETLLANESGIPANTAEVAESAPPITLPHTTPSPSRTTLLLTLIVLVLALYLSYLLAQRHRWVRVTIPVLVVVAMITSPLLQGAAHARSQNQEETKTLSEALGVERVTGETNQQPATSDPPLATNHQQQIVNESCGSGTTADDDDQDGTTNYVERCLGTDQYNIDTDFDGITDTVEIAGISYNGQTWYLNPLRMDSNFDGLSDFHELTAAYGGIAPHIDQDNDGIPNIWDNDNDGDGVLDAHDLDPFSVTGYQDTFSLSTTLEQSTFTNYQYIEIQLQPQDSTHLRYTTTSLDWPTDDEGTIQDLDGSLEDIQLSPYLKVTTIGRPNDDLISTYGITFSYLGNVGSGWQPIENRRYELFIPLNPLSHGGQITAFQGKIVYEPEMIASITWTDMELVWMVSMANDEQNGDMVATETKLVAQYNDPFRITGLEITKSGDASYALFGTPNTPTDNRDLFQLLFGLEASYLSALSPDLDQIISRFSSPATPPIQTWGIPAADVAVLSPPGDQTPAHLDELITSAAGSLPTFLENNNYPQDEMVTVALATQTELGIAGLDDLDNAGGTHFVFNLANIPLATSRSLKTYNLQKSGDTWTEVKDVALWTAVADRYGDFATILAELQTRYPHLTETELFAVIYGFTNAWAAGQTAVIQLDGITLAAATTDDAAIFAHYDVDTATDAVTYLIEANNLAVEGAGLLSVNPDSYYNYLRERGFLTFDNIALTATKQVVLIYLSKVSLTGMGKYLKFATIGSKVKVLSPQLNGIAYWDDWLREVSLFTGGVKTGDDLLNSSAKVSKFVYRSSATLAKAFTIIGIITSVIALGFELYTIWNAYLEYSSPYGYEQDFALAFAITRTVVAVILFIIALTGVGAFILLVFAIVGLVVSAIAWAFGEEFDLTSFLLEGLIDKFWHVDAYTRFLDFDFAGLESEVNEGLIQGATINFSDHFTGYIYRREGNDNSQLNRSTSYGYFSASADPGVSISTHRTDADCSIRSVYVTGGHWYGPTQECENDLYADFTFNNASGNVDLHLLYKVAADTRYEECIVGFCSNETDHMVLPDELADENKWDTVTLTFDVLPDSIEALWNWSHLENPDKDGDDLANDALMESAAFDSDGDGLVNPLDWDSDNDGLSDGFEKKSYGQVGADALLQDSDGDGLSDGQELQLGTIINDADSDDDGLSDGEETFHWDGSQWTGGGWFINIDGHDYWVFADPINGDADGDGLNDSTEKNAASSPNAANEAPSLTLEAGPYLVSPTGAAAVYAANNQTITATVNLRNLAGTAIAETLSFCVPATLTNINITTAGDSTTLASQNGNCYDYDFSADPLLFFQQFNLNLTATAGSDTTADTFTASLPHEIAGTLAPVAVTLPYQQDNEAPTVEITAPLNDTILIGDTYIIGGFAQDSDSWVDNVQVSLPAGTFTATAASPWAYSWDLPDEGLATLTAVAYDVVGNPSPPFNVQVTVDSLAPIITSDLPPNITISAGQSYSNTIDLSGTVSDNYAGLARVQLRYNEQPWRTIWSSDTAPLNTTWNGLWELPAITESTQGEHTLHLRAYDAYGNISYLEQTVFVDILPPTSDLTNRTFLRETPPHVALNDPLTLYGVANDAGHNPLPAGPADLAGNLHSISDATLWLQPDAYEDDDAGVTAAWIGDFNGDRLGDLAVGLPAAANGAGKVVVVTGAAGDWPIPNIGDLEFLSDHKPSFIGTAGAGLGSVVQPAGDFDGNGFDDLLIGDPANNRLFLVYGTPRAFGFEQELAASNPTKWAELLSTLEGETITSQVAAAGDVNNDTLGDILISTTTAQTGYVYLLLGDASPNENHFINEAAAAVMETSTAGTSVAAVGDVNGDFIDDFAIATNGTIYLFAGGGGWIERGLTNLNTGLAMASFTTSDSLPTIVGAGDVNGDGVADFAYSSSDTPVVVFGSAAQNFTTQTLSGFGSPLSGFLAAAGDVDKDDRGDFLIGNAAGDATLILGSNLNSAAATIEGVASAAAAPYIAGADLAGDGSSDLLVVPSEDAASGLGYTALNQVQAPFINQAWLPTSELAATAVNHAPSQPKSESPLLSSPPMGGIEGGRSLLSGDVTVGIAGADYTSIQEAINSGADRVLIEPGIYQEVITLTSNVIVAGSGPGLTTLTFPDDSSATTLVTADGVSNSILMNVTLAGRGTETGLSVLNGASNMMLARAIVRDMGTAVLIDGSTTGLDLKNNSLIANNDGLNATNCAAIDIRNTIFAYNTGTALQYEGCAPIQNHQFNLYWANGADMSPNDPGGGELFSDPLFVDFGGNDFRTERHSPVIDAGSPGDAVPPGAGSSADIGHMEQTGASFFAGQSYCATCVNDGLIWQVDAFNSIQTAVDAAQADLAVLRDSDGTQFTVGVGSGIYTESVVISYNLRLLGSGADATTIQGNGGPAVTLQSTAGTELSGFTLVGDGADPVGVHVTGGSNSAFISRNLIKDNETGILMNGRSSGIAQFNTIIANTTAILASDRYDWLDTNSNLISGNSFGLFANTVTTTAVITNSIVVTTATGTIFSDNNLFFNTVNYTNVFTGVSDIVGVDPLLAGDYAYLQVGSPAIDAGLLSEPAPVGGGARADIGWHELLAAPISILMGQPDDSVATENIGVGQVEYAIVPVADVDSDVTSTLPTSWQSAPLATPGQKLTYWEATYTPTSTGYYRIYSRAADTLGNAEVNTADWYEGAFYTDDTAPIVTLQISLIPNAGNQWAKLSAEVTDYVGTSFDVSDIYFEINGQRVEGLWSLDQWQPDGVTPRKFHTVFMNRSGSATDFALQAFAVDGAGQIGSSAIINQFVNYNPVNYYYDATAPEVTNVTIEDDNLPIPPYDELVGGQVTIRGEGHDLITDNDLEPPFETYTRINGYELSFDGGLSWETAQIANYSYSSGNNEFVYTYTVPADLDATTIPIKIRVTDLAGFSTVHVVTMTVDTGAPRLAGEVQVNSEAVVGSHLDDSLPVTFGWREPVDGSSRVQMYANFGTQEESDPPTAPINETSADRAIEGPGVFRASIGGADQSGNIDWVFYGDWWVGSVGSPFVDWNEGSGSQSLALTSDGILEIDHNEWLTATEWLDDDDRRGIPQSLYATWDGRNSYIGWQGASWDNDGTMWVYWDILDGSGTDVPVAGTVSLPFAADYAVNVGAGFTSDGWAYDGANWVTSELPPFMGHDPDSGGTELIFEFGTTMYPANFDHHRMLAYAVNDSGAVWSAFPVLNKLDGNFAYYYEWIVNTGPDLLQRPVAAREPVLFLNAASLPPTQDTLSHGSPVQYILDIANNGQDTSENLQVQLNGSPGVNYLAVSGASCNSCASPDNWLLAVPDIPSGQSQRITITAQLDSDLTGLAQVTTTVKMQTDLLLPQVESMTHALDLVKPSVALESNPAQVIAAGPQEIVGSASDNFGTGVELVEVSVDGTNWQAATGTQSWSAIIAPGVATGSGTFYGRATDYHGHVSDVTTIPFIIDEVAPLITPTVPTLVSNAIVASISGSASDPSPSGALVRDVAVQFDGETTAWLEGTVNPANPSGSQSWQYGWALPLEDWVTHTVRFRATDYGNNQTTTGWYTTVVDTVAPTITMTQQLTQVVQGGSSPALAGLVSDGGTLDTVTVQLYPQAGPTISDTVTVNNGQWTYTLNQPLGQYTLLLTFSDTAGNSHLLGPFAVEVVADTGNNNPVALDDSVTTNEDTAVAIDVLANDSDPDGDSLSIDTITQPVSGTAIISGTLVVYTPTPGFTGGDTFAYTISDGQGGTDTATVNVTVTATSGNQAYLAVIMTDDIDPIESEQLLTYTLIVTNNGPDLATAVRLTDTLPLDVTFKSVTTTAGNCLEEDGEVLCDLGNLSSGSSITITITVMTGAAGDIINTVNLSGNEFDPDLADNSATETTTVIVTETYYCEGVAATIVGTPGDDLLNGTPADDIIVALGGNDTINGRSGNDIICGGAGNDTLKGDAGDDILKGGPGDDLLEGSSGQDQLWGGQGIDSLNGGSGSDELHGGPAADTLEGGSGVDILYGGLDNDLLLGQAGTDILYGQQGSDNLQGGSGADELYGGQGNDTLAGDAGADWLDGGLGTDDLDGGSGYDGCIHGETVINCEY